MNAYAVQVAGFDELPTRTAYALWALRSSVFVVEQDCVYLDLDGRDLEPTTRHVWAEGDAGELVGCLRILDDGDHARIGRVLVVPAHRGRGVAGLLMQAALDRLGDRPSVLAAQTYVAGWYARFGYVRMGPDFDEDGKPHTPMRRGTALTP